MGVTLPPSPRPKPKPCEACVSASRQYVINAKADWDKNKNLEILHIEDWKPGVKRLHCRDLSQQPEFWMVFCRDGHLPDRTNSRYAEDA